MAKLLRDEKEILLNDLLRGLRKAAGHYRAAAGVLKDDAAAARLERLAQSRDEAVRSLEGFIRKCGFLPEAPDPDRQTVVNLAERARTFFAKDQPKTVFDRSALLEKDLQERWNALLDQSWPAEGRRELSRLAQESEPL